MSLPNNTDPIYNKEIHFDTLLEISLDDIHHYSKDIWSDKGEHDPGVTILQALTWSTADLAFRHTFPIEDLLVPSLLINEDNDNRKNIFSSDFGPENVLTTAPITLDDYRRCLMDLVCDEGTNEAKFCFNDIKIYPIKNDADKYSFDYEVTTGHFNFQKPTGFSEPLPPVININGDYQIYYQLARGVNENAANQKLLNTLKDSRNLCENFVKPISLEAIPVPLRISLELTDDCVEYQQVLENLLHEVESFFTPNLFRGRFNQGSELEGPKSSYGIIRNLPLNQQDSAYQINLMALAKILKNIEGVKSITNLAIDELPNELKLIMSPNKYAIAWGVTQNQVLTEITRLLKFTKKGQGIDLKDHYTTAATSLFIKNKPIKTEAKKLIIGRDRNAANYFPSSDFLPAQYGFKSTELNPVSKDLANFFLPFETWNYLQQANMIMLSEGLRFQRKIESFTFKNWLTLAHFTGPNVIFKEFDSVKSKAVADLCATLFYSSTRELNTTNYLLNYFGESRANRTLQYRQDAKTSDNNTYKNSDTDKEYIDMQHGLLKEVPTLYYNRSKIDITKVSSLQKIIAARLGRGSTLFSEKPKLDELPFYIIENRQLLPPLPDLTKLNDSDEIINVTIQANNFALELKSNTLNLRVGMLCDLTLTNLNATKGENADVKYTNLLVHLIDKTIITFYLSDDNRLNSNSANILKNITGNKYSAKLQVSSKWLRNFRSPITNYKSDNGNTIFQLSDELSPWLQYESTISIYSELNKPIPIESFKTIDAPIDLVTNMGPTLIKTSDPDKRGAAFKSSMAVINIDRVNKSFSVKGDITLVPTSKYYYEVDPTSNNEPFSFTLSFVFQDSWLPTDKKAEFMNWINATIREVIPLHINIQTYYLPQIFFEPFGKTYKAWSEGNYLFSGGAYDIIEQLSLGQRPKDYYPGIGTMRVKKIQAVGAQLGDDTTIKTIEQAFKDNPNRNEAKAARLKAYTDSDIFFIDENPTP